MKPFLIAGFAHVDQAAPFITIEYHHGFPLTNDPRDLSQILVVLVCLN